MTTPTLVIHSREDALVPFEEGRILASSIPGSSFVSLESRNHLVLEDEPAWWTFVSEVRAFLGIEQGSESDESTRRADGEKASMVVTGAAVGGDRDAGMGVFERLRRHKLIEWALAYLAAAWVLLEVLGFVSSTFGWPIGLLRGATVLLGVGSSLRWSWPGITARKDGNVSAAPSS